MASSMLPSSFSPSSMLPGGESLSLLGIKNDDGPCPSMSMTQRLIGCAVCLALGSLLSLGGLSRVISLLKGNPTPFVVFTTFGTILSLSAAFFLAGPAKQLRQMTDKKRRWASVTLLVCIVATLGVAWGGSSLHGQGAILLMLCVVQMITQAYYIFTYVPFSDKLLEGFCSWCRQLGDR